MFGFYCNHRFWSSERCRGVKVVGGVAASGEKKRPFVILFFSAGTKGQTFYLKYCCQYPKIEKDYLHFRSFFVFF